MLAQCQCCVVVVGSEGRWLVLCFGWFLWFGSWYSQLASLCRIDKMMMVLGLGYFGVMANFTIKRQIVLFKILINR